MRAAGLINNGKFNYEAFNGIPKYKQGGLIALHKNFLERYGGASNGGASTNYIAICIHTYTCF